MLRRSLLTEDVMQPDRVVQDALRRGDVGGQGQRGGSVLCGVLGATE